MNKFRYGIATLAVIVAATGVALAGSSSSGHGPKEKADSYKINATGGSGQHGTVTLTPWGRNRTKVTISITGEPALASEPAHIHVGKCPSPGAVNWPLSNVVHGSSVTIVNAGADMIGKPGYAVNIHRTGALPPPYKACGNL